VSSVEQKQDCSLFTYFLFFCVLFIIIEDIQDFFLFSTWERGAKQFLCFIFLLLQSAEDDDEGKEEEVYFYFLNSTLTMLLRCLLLAWIIALYICIHKITLTFFCFTFQTLIMLIILKNWKKLYYYYTSTWWWSLLCTFKILKINKLHFIQHSHQPLFSILKILIQNKFIYPVKIEKKVHII
jgi:hypothetical protein